MHKVFEKTIFKDVSGGKEIISADGIARWRKKSVTLKKVFGRVLEEVKKQYSLIKT
ncbi:MAG TPA: hypothetical protein VK400_08505 [Pyrinomonadaceae bacterium]|nr:hypothetical protein [Pyrinomonadaceae bacterium]